MNEGPALIVRLCDGALHRIFGFVVGVGVKATASAKSFLTAATARHILSGIAQGRL